MEPAVEILLRSVKGLCPKLTDEELQQFASKLIVRELQKKEAFVQEDKVQKVS